MSSRGRTVAVGAPYAAAAMSLVFHPAHPLVPTLRADVRLFQASLSPLPELEAGNWINRSPWLFVVADKAAWYLT